jgi:toxin ParE1/3/4
MPAYRLAEAAEADIVDLLAYTEREFGSSARRRYEALVGQAIRDVAADPLRPGCVARPELGAGICSYHLRNSRERARTSGGLVGNPRHLLLYRPIRPGLIGIGRVLHDAMELERHLPRDFMEG